MVARGGAAHAYESTVADLRALAGMPAKKAVPRLTGDVIGAICQAAADSRDRRGKDTADMSADEKVQWVARRQARVVAYHEKAAGVVEL